MATSAVPASTYQPKSFDKSTYEVSSYQYPSDLMVQEARKGMPNGQSYANKYGNNYVVFYINVNNESKMLKNPNILTTPIDASERVKKEIVGKDYNQIATGAAVTAEAALGAGVFSGGSPKAVALAGAAAALGSAAVIGNASSEPITKNSTFSRPQKRLKAAIALHVPNQLSIKYGANWSDEETFGMQALLSGGEAVARALQEGGKDALSNLVNGDKGISSIVANIALSKGPGGAALSALSGLAPNPMKEQIFKGVDFRTFTMDYQFAPRDKEEARNVLQIIQAFKYHMHPEFKDGGNFLFLYPSEFDITYFHGGQENNNIHRHTSCVLTDMDVNYTPNGNFSTFEGGMPTQINVTLSFKELTILTKELIAEGL